MSITVAAAIELQEPTHNEYSLFRHGENHGLQPEVRKLGIISSATESSNGQSAQGVQQASDSDSSLQRILRDAIATGVPVEPVASAKSLKRANLIIFQVSVINFLTSMSTGLIVVGLPRIATDLSLPERLYLWPSSVFGLTAGATLLIAGAVADVIGARPVELVGTTLLGIFTLACGLANTGIQLVMFRALQGISNAMHQPCSVALVTQLVPSGKRRNVGFACLGLSMPLGFSLGLIIGGIFVDTIGWRAGFYIAGSIMILQSAAGLRLIPAEGRPENVMHKLKNDIDWIGATMACAGLAMFSYVLAALSTDSNNIRRPVSIATLTISVILIGLFPVWMARQDGKGRPALIPNYFWKNIPFASICVLTILTWGVMNSMEVFSSLYFQEVQEVSALQASLRILPSLVVGTVLNLTTGYFVDRVPAFWLVLVTTTLTAVAPMLMALIDPHWSYWRGAFFAQCLAPLSGDVLFTVGLIVVSGVFPERTQALAGAVFNTVAFFGMSLGLNVMQVVSILVTKGTQYRDKSSPAALLQGYQASFWAMFAATITCALLCAVGLRNVGKVGMKRD